MTTLGRIGDVLWHVVLPLACMTYGSLAALSRYMRAGLLDVLQADFIRTARAKGLSERVVIGKHALRNGLLPIITLLGPATTTSGNGACGPAGGMSWQVSHGSPARAAPLRLMRTVALPSSGPRCT